MFEGDLHHPEPALEEKLRRLYALNNIKKIDMGFRAPYLELLKKFENPHTKLPPVIHVAGTNGKGSIIAALRTMLQAGGYRVHAYTSPHLCAFNERIILAGRMIGHNALSDLIDEALRLNGKNETTFFEITTAMAFATFARTPADILLLETGMGGRLDCTNVIDHSLVTIIGAIGYDHMEHLGDNLCKIAGEKAGIMKPGVPCVIAHQSKQALSEGVMNVFQQRAVSVNATLYLAGAQWFCAPEKDRMHFVFKHPDKSVDKLLPAPSLKGLHQVDNCSAALAALEIIKAQFPVNDEALRRGLNSITWPGRLQDISAHIPNLKPGWEVWLDGAHNEDGARILSTQAKAWQAVDNKPLHFIIGMMAHKDPQSFLTPLRHAAASVTFADIPGEPKSFRAEELRHQVAGSAACSNFLQAVDSISANMPTGRIMITGSLYLVGHVLKTLDEAAHNGSGAKKSHAA